MATADKYPSIQLNDPDSGTWANDALSHTDVRIINENSKFLNESDKQLETNYENAKINQFLTYYLDNLKKNAATSERAKANLFFLFDKDKNGGTIGGATLHPDDETGFMRIYSKNSKIKERAKNKLMELLDQNTKTHEDKERNALTILTNPSTNNNLDLINNAIATLKEEKDALANSDTNIKKGKKERYRQTQKAVKSLETNSPSTSDKLKKATNYQEVIEKLNNNRPRRNWIDKFSSSAEKKSFRLKTTKTQGNLKEATFNRVKNKKTTIKITCAKTIWNANTGGYDVADQFGRDHSRVSKELENLSIHDIEKILNELKNDPSFDHNGLKLKHCDDGSVEWSLKINKGMSKFLKQARETSAANTKALEASRERKHAGLDTNRNNDEGSVRDNIGGPGMGGTT